MNSANSGAMLYQLSYEAKHWEQGQFMFTAMIIFHFHLPDLPPQLKYELFRHITKINISASVLFLEYS